MDIAATATNHLGLDLFRQLAAERPGENLVLSPYAIQNALALVYAGADGSTRSEMARVLHFPPDALVRHPSFDALRTTIDSPVKPTLQQDWKTASRLFVQQGYLLRDSFLTFIRECYPASLQAADFTGDPVAAQVTINTWIRDQTKSNVANFFPTGAVSSKSSVVLASTFALHARWEEAFDPAASRPRPFHLSRSSEVQVSFMTQTLSIMTRASSGGYSKQDRFTAITLPFARGELQLLILLPDDVEGADELSRNLNPQIFRDCAKFPIQQIALFIPRFQIEGAGLSLGKTLQNLGMKSLFKIPVGNGNLARVGGGNATSPLGLSEVLHRTSVRANEAGVSSGSLLTVYDVNGVYGSSNTIPSPRIQIDHPFLFAVLHRATGTCLLLGRVSDPR